MQAAEAGGDGDGAEELRECKLNDEPLDPSSELPNAGTLQLVYFSTLQQDTITFDLSLDLASDSGSEHAITLRLWERALTTPTDDWLEAKLDGNAVAFDDWQYPNVPNEGTLQITYSVRRARRRRQPSPQPPPSPERSPSLRGGSGGGVGGAVARVP